MKTLLGIVFGMLLMFSTASAQKLPGEAPRHLPYLVEEINTYWPDLSPRSFPAGLIDQESNWKPNAQLKTARELGCGYGQFTKAVNADGSVRFDALAETKRLAPEALKDWDWRDCANVRYQLRGTVLKLKSQDRSCAALMVDSLSAKACNAAKYNGGAGSIDKRIRYCRATPGCDPKQWFGNLERQCPQAKVKVAGYGESFCDINSKYPGRVFARMPKFEPYMGLKPK